MHLHFYLGTVSKVQELFSCLDSSCSCVGNHDDNFLALPSVRKGVMKDHLSKINVLVLFLYSIITFLNLLIQEPALLQLWNQLELEFHRYSMHSVKFLFPDPQLPSDVLLVLDTENLLLH